MTIFNVYDKLTLEPGEDDARDIIAYGSYLYVLCGTRPARVVEVAITPFRRTRAVTLPYEAGEGVNLVRAGEFLYVLCDPGVGYSAKIVKISIATFSIIGTLTLGSDEEVYTPDTTGKNLAVSEDGSTLYVGVERRSIDTRAGIARVDLKTFKETGILWFETGESNPCGICVYRGYIYVACFPGAPGIIVKVDLATFTRVRALDISATNLEPRDPVAYKGFLYVLAYGVYPGVSKINLETFTWDSQLQLDFDLESYRLYCYLGSLYWGSYRGPKLVRAKLDEWPKYAVLDLSPHTSSGIVGMAASDIYLYVCVRSSPGMIIKVQIEVERVLRYGACEPLVPRLNEMWAHEHHWESGEVAITTSGSAGQKNLGDPVPSGKVRRITELTIRHTGTNDTVVTLLVAGGETKLTISVPAQTTRVWSSRDGRVFTAGQQPAVESSDVTGGYTYISASGVEE